ncbi:MAG: 30S ribosomal protein S1 [Fimbriimonadaceae bacterium]|nr:30S ribosomal protein S1 [Fimbriimonadaceae bacterium]
MNDDMLTPTGEPTSATTAVQTPVPAEPEAATGVAPETTTMTAEAPAAEAPTPEPAPEFTAPEPAPEPPAPVVEAQAPPAPAPEPPAKPVESMDDTDLFAAAMAELEQKDDSDTSYRKLTKGDRVEATVIQVERDRVFVDLGTKSEGVVPLAELTEEYLESAHGHVQPGDKIQVVVLRGEGGEGNPIVSKKRAEFEETWNRIVESFGDGKTMTAQVVDRVKGGLVVDIGVRGFVPATHVGNGKLRNIEKYVGQSISLKIIEIDRERKKVVLSNKLAEDEKRENVKGEIFSKVNPGDILEGTVRRLTDYGAFVDLGGIDGLLHISEMSWMRINHPKEVLKEGQKIKVMVLRLDPNVSKISLGLRQVLPDPWNLIRENYKIGQKIQCKINRLVQSGAFVKLPEGAEAFLPVSEISTRRINKPGDVLVEGQDVELSIIDLRPDERRMVLSLRGSQPLEPRTGYDPGGGYGGGGGGGYDDDFRKGPGAKKGGKKRGGRGGRGDEDEFDGPIMGRVPTGGATIGERLGLLKGFLGRPDEDDEEVTEDVEAETTAEVVAEAPTEPAVETTTEPSEKTEE